MKMITEAKFKHTVVGAIPEDWEVKKLEDVCEKRKGSIISGPFGSNIGSRFFVSEGIPVIRGNNITTDFNKFVDEGFVFITEEKADELNTWADEDDLVFTAAGTLGQVGIIPKKRKFKRYIISNKQLRARLDKKEMIPLFAFYWFKTRKMVEYINVRSTGSTIPLINLSVLKSLPIPCPEIREQEAITKVLYDLDTKIELNQQMNKTLEAMAQAIFKHWFIDFEFPNEEGKPYKSSGGEMIYNEELGKEIPEGCLVRTLHEITDNFDSERIPLSSRERESRRGGYPYYGATGIIDHVNDFIFDGTFVLMGEDGSVIDGAGHPILQYVWGKFWVNNHAHVLRGKGVSNELLYMLLKNANVGHIVTGAVQPKINQGNMNKLRFALPPQDILQQLEKVFDALFQRMRLNSEEVAKLSLLRDSLLPTLMSGRIRVPVEVR